MTPTLAVLLLPLLTSPPMSAAVPREPAGSTRGPASVVLNPSQESKETRSGQEKKPAAKQGEKDGKQAKKPLWPPVKPVRKRIARDKIALLASKDKKKVAAAREKLLSYGPGICPVLLRSMHAKKNPIIVKELQALVDQLAGPEFAEGLAAAYDSRDEVRGLYIVRRLRSFENKELAPFFRKATKNKHAVVVETAWFALAELGDVESLSFLLEVARKSWKERALDIIDVLPNLKGKKASDYLVDKLRDKDVATKVASLRLLWGAGTKDCVSVVAAYLRSEEHRLRVGAVNALRGIVDGDPPYKHLPVFDAIGEVEKWKRRTGR